MAAPNFKLDNLYAIIDKNNFQQTGSNKEIMSVESLKDKWSSFGWHTVELDGHNIEALYNFFNNSGKINKPKAIIANTTKGKGFSFSENNNDWHHKVLSKSQYELAIKELNKFISHVHIKDKNHYGDNVLLGSGLVDFSSIFDSLNKINYKH